VTMCDGRPTLSVLGSLVIGGGDWAVARLITRA